MAFSAECGEKFSLSAKPAARCAPWRMQQRRGREQHQRSASATPTIYLLDSGRTNNGVPAAMKQVPAKSSGKDAACISPFARGIRA
jgi:hypothetical protein